MTGVEGTGVRQYIPDGGVDLIPDYDPRSGDHYWFFPVGFHIANPMRHVTGTDPMQLDKENLVLATAIGCFYCEKVFEPMMLHRRCPGKPPAGES